MEDPNHQKPQPHHQQSKQNNLQSTNIQQKIEQPQIQPIRYQILPQVTHQQQIPHYSFFKMPTQIDPNVYEETCNNYNNNFNLFFQTINQNNNQNHNKKRKTLKAYKQKQRNARKLFNPLDLDKISKQFQKWILYDNGESEEKITISNIARKYNYGFSTISRLLKEYLDDPQLSKKRQCLEKKVIKSRDDITKRRLIVMEEILKQNPQYVQREIAQRMNQDQSLKRIKGHGQVSITSKNVSRLLKIAGYRRKLIQRVPIYRNTKDNIEKRYQYCKRFLQLIQQKRNIYFLDQSGFSVNATRMRAWAKSKQEVRIKCQLSKNQIVSLLAVIGINGLACWDVKIGNYDRISYLRLINDVFDKVGCDSGVKNVLIMDNCTIHDKLQTNRLSQDKNIEILFLPPYSPQLNPIQNWFHEIKSKVRQKMYKNSTEMLIEMKNILAKYNQHSFQNYYRSINEYLEKGLKRIPL